jgi:hypothetical protein
MRLLNYLITILLISTTSYASPIGGGPIGGGTSGGGSGDITSVGSCTSGDCTNAFINDTAIDLTSLTLNDLTFDVGSVSKTEFGYLNGVTSNIQSQINALGGGGGAPIDVQYWVSAANGTLTNEVVVNSPASLENAANLGLYSSDILGCNTLAALMTLINGGDYSPTAAVDLTSASSVTSGPLAWTSSASLPGSPTDGQFTYYTGGTFDVMGFYNSDTWRYFLAFDSFPDTSGQVPTYNGSGEFSWSVPVVSDIEVSDIADSAVETSSEGLTNTNTALPTSAAVKAYADALAISGSTPTVQASDPTIASSTRYYIATNDYHFFWNEYGVRTVDLTAGTLDDSDTTDPVNADGGTDSTHDGTTLITLDVDVTEQYISTVTYSSTELSLTDVAMSQSGTAPNYTYTASVDPNGSTSTIDLVVTSTDLAGNTDEDTYNVTYSGGTTPDHSFALDSAVETSKVYDSIADANVGSGADTVTFTTMADTETGARANGTGQSVSLTSDTYMGQIAYTIYFEFQNDSNSQYNYSFYQTGGGDDVQFRAYSTGTTGLLYVRTNYGTAAAITFTSPTTSAVHSARIALDYANATPADRINLWIDDTPVDTSAADMTAIADPGTISGNVLFPYQPSAGAASYIKNLKFYTGVVAP